MAKRRLWRTSLKTSNNVPVMSSSIDVKSILPIETQNMIKRLQKKMMLDMLKVGKNIKYLEHNEKNESELLYQEKIKLGLLKSVNEQLKNVKLNSDFLNTLETFTSLGEDVDSQDFLDFMENL